MISKSSKEVICVLLEILELLIEMNKHFFTAIFSALVIFSCCMVSCKQKSGTTIPIINTEVLHQNQDQLTQVIIYDFFTPPVASRIYGYTSLASYEAVRFLKPGAPSLTALMNGFDPMPVPEKDKPYDFTLAASQAFFTVAHKVIFSVDTLLKYETVLFDSFKEKINDEAIYNRSIDFGTAVGNTILKRAVSDNYTKSRGKAKYLGSHEAGKWTPTPPDYLDGVEWCWNEIPPLLLDSVSQFFPEPPPAYSTDTSSQFFKMVMEVYQKAQTLTDEEKEIARYWDDNPFVIEHSGHLMFANKKITPGGHWMGIAAIVSKMAKDDEVKTARSYALTAIALFDAFISCWDAKYHYDYIRPITVINERINKSWTSYLQTPPFPEYSSGHSTITASAAKMLTHIYGDNFAFLDTSDLRYIGMQRQFTSFMQAAQECSISRFYGGIHYRFTVDKSAAIGERIGDFLYYKMANAVAMP